MDTTQNYHLISHDPLCFHLSLKISQFDHCNLKYIQLSINDKSFVPCVVMRKTFECVSGFLSHGQTLVRSAGPRSSSSPPARTVTQGTFVEASSFMRISAGFSHTCPKCQKVITYFVCPKRFSIFFHDYSQLASAASLCVASPQSQRENRVPAPSACAALSFCGPEHTAAPAYFWAVDPWKNMKKYW